jgi:hypothetical protein
MLRGNLEHVPVLDDLAVLVNASWQLTTGTPGSNVPRMRRSGKQFCPSPRVFRAYTDLQEKPPGFIKAVVRP